MTARHRNIRAFFVVVAAVVSLLRPARLVAGGPDVTISVSSESLYVGVPFVISVVAGGFDESPPPDVGKIQIAGCTGTFMGLQPNVSSFVSISNGQRSESKLVRWIGQYRVTCDHEGKYRVQPVTVRQGSLVATTQAGEFRVQSVPPSADMRLELEMPERPVWVGESFPLTIHWDLRRDVGEQNFSIPLFGMEDKFEVKPESDPGQGQGQGQGQAQALAFPAGSQELRLPFTRSQVTVGGGAYTRFTFKALVTPLAAGKISLPPARVVAGLRSGLGGGMFGFVQTRSQLFSAEDRARTITVLPPPGDRPRNFSGAVGTGFTLEVKADRTIVRVGDPIQLDILIRGHGRLEGVGADSLLNTDNFPPAQFSLPEPPPAGEMLADGGKRFRATIRLKSADTREIPGLVFAYFNPSQGKYQTVESVPIALSVKEGTVVGAASVVSAKPSGEALPSSAGTTSATAPGGTGVSLVGANLALSDPEKTLVRSFEAREAAPVASALYALALLFLGGKVWMSRTAGSRGQRREQDRALEACLKELDESAALPAKEGGSRAARALRELRGKVAPGQAAPDGTISKLEASAYDPAVNQKPLSSEILDEARRAAGELATAAKRSAAFMLVLLLVLPLAVRAAEVPAADLAPARQLYESALSNKDPVARQEAFGQAATRFAAAVEQNPKSPELLADWGNAALGAQELGTAALAYRRALLLDPGNSRARTNLQWIRSRLPDWAAPPGRSGALESLLAVRSTLSPAVLLLASSVSFLLVALLVAPWGVRTPVLRRLAILPAIGWCLFTAAWATVPSLQDAAVVVQDGVTLKAADSPGAPPVYSQAIPSGAEITVLEARDTWVRVELGGGLSGWLPASAVGRVSAGH